MITVFIFGGKHKVRTTPKVAAKHKGKHPIESNPLVRFTYPMSDMPYVGVSRDVRVIGTNEKYVIGVQVNGKPQFKKFLKSKMSNFQLVEFNPEAVK